MVVALLLPAGLCGEGEGDLGAVGLAEDGLRLLGPGHAVLVLGQGDADLPKVNSFIKIVIETIYHLATRTSRRLCRRPR